MPSNKPQILIRPTEEQMAAIKAASEAAASPSVPAFVLATVLGSIGKVQPLAPAPSAPKPIIFKPRSVVVTAIARDFTERSEPIPESAPDPFIERQFGSKLRQEFGSQHEFLMGQKRQGKVYRAMTNQEKYEYHVKMKQEVGE